jgi:hypothetical protein
MAVCEAIHGLAYNKPYTECDRMKEKLNSIDAEEEERN